MGEQKYYSTIETAQILGISRIAVYKKVKSGVISARKIGRNYAVPSQEVEIILGKTLDSSQKRLIKSGVAKTVREYGEALKMLGRQ